MDWRSRMNAVTPRAATTSATAHARIRPIPIETMAGPPIIGLIHESTLMTADRQAMNPMPPRIAAVSDAGVLHAVQR